MAAENLKMKPKYYIAVVKDLKNAPLALLCTTEYGQGFLSILGMYHQWIKPIAKIAWNGIKPLKTGYITSRRAKKLKLE